MRRSFAGPISWGLTSTRPTSVGPTSVGADLTGADLTGAKLTGADLTGAIFQPLNLRGADLSFTRFGTTTFADVDLSEVTGLELANHIGPSTVGIDTLFRSKGRIPEAFLRDCGVPEPVIVNRYALIGAPAPIQFYSCFISYSSKDEEFAKRLHGRMVQEKLRVWFAPENMQGGKKILEQIDRAIQLHDRLLLVLSEHSMRASGSGKKSGELERPRSRKDEGSSFLFGSWAMINFVNGNTSIRS